MIKFRLRKRLKNTLIIIAFVGALAFGLVLENVRDDRFIVETISGERNAPVVMQDKKSETPDNLVADGKININTAGIELLTQLSGIGESTAQKIIDYRNEHGEFSSVEELTLVPGIGEKKLEAIRDKICVK